MMQQEHPIQVSSRQTSLSRYEVFDHLLEGVQVVGKNWQYLYVNAAIARQGKTSKDRLLGKTMMQAYPGIESSEVFLKLKECMDSETSCQVLSEFEFPDGSKGWFDLRIQPVPEGLLILSFDVTEQKRMEKRLLDMNRELEQRVKEKTEELTRTHQRLNQELALLLQKSQNEISDYKHALDESCIVAITDQKGTIRYVNENFCKISRYSREELIGQDHRIINSAYHPKEFIRELWITIANGKVWRGELKNKTRDGSYYWVDTTIIPFLDENGKPYQYLAIRSDITKKKEAEEQLVKVNEELESKVKERTLELTHALEREKELSEMKSRFVSMASHEFRTPLSAILSSISLLEHYEGPEQAEKRMKHAERIKSSVKNLTSLLDDFLSLEKLEQGKVEVRATPFNCREFIEDVIDEMDGMARKKLLTIRLRYEGNTRVCLDKKILRNVLLNLLSNAVKYSPEGREIEIRAVVETGLLKIMVKDHGIGIPEEAQKQLFDKFFRAENAAHIQGTGLGLNIVKKYLELLNGKIHFESSAGTGTSFFVEMPCSEPEPC